MSFLNDCSIFTATLEFSLWIVLCKTYLYSNKHLAIIFTLSPINVHIKMVSPEVLEPTAAKAESKKKPEILLACILL